MRFPARVSLQKCRRHWKIGVLAAEGVVSSRAGHHLTDLGSCFPPSLGLLHCPKEACCPCPRPKGSTPPLACCRHHLVWEPECLGNISLLCTPSLHYCLSGSESLLSFFPHLCRSVSQFLLVLSLLISEALISSLCLSALIWESLRPVLASLPTSRPAPWR